MNRYFKDNSDVEYKNSSPNRDFHRGIVHNPKLYGYNNHGDDHQRVVPKYRSKFCKSNSPRYHTINNTFTIGSTRKHEQYSRSKHDLSLLTLSHKPNYVQDSKRILTRGQDVHYHTLNPRETLVPQHCPTTDNCIKSQSTQTPRFAVPNRQKKSVENFVVRNRKLHDAQNSERIRSFQNSSLTHLPRVYLPRLNLYSKVAERKDPLRGSVYDSIIEEQCPCCSTESPCYSSNSFADSENSEDEFRRHQVRKNFNSGPILEKIENIKHIQVLKNPIMWSNEVRNDEASKEESDSSENEWVIDAQDFPKEILQEPVFQAKSFDFWRDDDNFATDESRVHHQIDKRVRFGEY